MNNARLTFLALTLVVASARAQEGVCPAQWPLGDKPTAADQDDGFEGGFRAPWVVAQGSPGVVDLFRPTSNPTQVYDFSTIPGAMAVQSGPNKYNAGASNQVLLYQDYTLEDGESVVVALAAASGAKENGTNIGIWLSNSTTSPINAPALTPYVGVQIDAEFGQGYRIVATANNLHLPQMQPDGTSNTEEVVLLRIVRRGLTYSMFWSNNWGLVWSHVGTHSQVAPLSKLWLASQSFAVQNAIFYVPVHAVLWICLGGDLYQPW